MDFKIGGKIKELRLAKKLTQEQLGDSLGISYQAISKWENNIGLPDIAILPAIASYFGITMDELFCYNLKKYEDTVNKICDEAYEYRRNGELTESRRILTEGLCSYPDNDILLNNLLYTFDYETEADEVISIANKVIGITSMADVKYDALRILAEAYASKGDILSAEATIEQIPEIYFSKLSVAAWTLKGEKSFCAAKKEKGIALENLLQMMGIISEYYEKEEKYSEALSEAECALGILEVIKDKAYSEHYEADIKAHINRLKSLR